MNDNNFPLVSIVLTTYNGSNCIKRCLTSAFNQNYPNIEIIIVDDNGKDTDEQKKTFYEISEFLGEKRVRYIVHSVNMNGAVARNTGIKNSYGDYIAFLDDDDVLYVDSIHHRVKALKERDDSYGFVLTSFRIIRDGFPDEDIILDFDGYILEEYLMMKYQSPSTVIMVKRETVEKIGYWDETFLRHQDWEFLARLSSICKGCSVNKVTADKYVLQRNYPRDPDAFRDRRLHYMNTVNRCMINLSPKTQKEIQYLHYYDIAKEYFKGKKFRSCLKWCLKSKHLFRSLVNIAKDGVIFLLKRK